MTICATARRRNGTKCETSAATTDGDSLTLISICKFLIKAFEQNTHLGSKASFSEGGQFNLDSCVCRGLSLGIRGTPPGNLLKYKAAYT